MEPTKHTVTVYIEISVLLADGKHPADLVRAVTEKMEGLARYVSSDPQRWPALDGGRIEGELQVTGVVVRDDHGTTEVVSGSAVGQNSSPFGHAGQSK